MVRVQVVNEVSLEFHSAHKSCGGNIESLKCQRCRVEFGDLKHVSKSSLPGKIVKGGRRGYAECGEKLSLLL